MEFYTPKLRSDFLGRVTELRKINEVLQQESASILVVYGRRRVGKTALIEYGFKGQKLLKFEGLESGSSARQREHFKEQLAGYFKDPEILKLNLKSWKDCFLALANRIGSRKCVLYFEELQWMANYRAELISDLKYVWDNFFSKISGLTLVLCGSYP